VLVTLVVIWLQLPLLDATQLAPQWDEFIRHTNARRVALGERPFVDYFDHAGVGADLTIGLFYAWLGEVNAGATRLLQIVFMTGAALAVFFALRARAVPLLTAAAVTALMPLVWFQTWPIPHHHWLAACWGALALAAAVRTPFVAGVFLGLSLLSSQTAGLVACAAGGAWLLGLPDARRVAARVSLGVALVGAVFLGWLASFGGLAAFIDATVIFPLTSYRAEGGPNDVTFFGELAHRFSMLARVSHAPALRLLAQASLAAAATVPLVLVAAGAFTAVRASRVARVAWLGVAVAVWIAFRPRPEVFHAAAFAVLPALALTLHTAALPFVQRAVTWVAVAACAVGLVSLCVNRALAPSPPSVLARVTEGDPLLVGLPEADAWMIQQDRRLAFVRRFALDHPQARMFAAPVGAIAYAFGPRPATAYTLVYEPTGQYLREQDHARIADELAARPADLVMITSRAAEEAFFHPPAASGPAVHRLAALLRDGYEEIGRDQSTVFFVPRH
jgi:4-amino-4-deoxy-L-arabinose transferase-like glycosyltransferase